MTSDLATSLIHQTDLEVDALLDRVVKMVTATGDALPTAAGASGASFGAVHGASVLAITPCRTMRLRTPSDVVEQGAYAAKCKFWDELGYQWVLKP